MDGSKEFNRNYRITKKHEINYEDRNGNEVFFLLTILR
jgi:hypothetical protein